MAVEPKVMEHVRAALESFGSRYIDHGVLKRNAVIEDLDAYDEQLMTRLLADELIHRSYTKKIADVEIFEVNHFISMLEFKDYWEDSYTKYSNKIGLTAGGKFIDESADVVLDFPFKDTILKAGMSKEDVENQDDADEPFLNQVIAKPEIDELLEPKVFKNVKRYDKDGEHGANYFSDQDNLIIKGNNLIALYSLRERYAGKIQAIYIDPPFNTGNDSFKYNDKFNESTWLTFMKNRLDIAKELLDSKGNIFIHLDINENYKLRVLADDIFGKDNFVEEIIWSYGSASGGRSAGAKPVNVHDYILHYSKNYKQRRQFKTYTPYSEKYIHDWFKYEDEDGRVYRRRQRGKDSNGNPIWHKQYLDESKGIPLTTVWSDIKQVYANPQAYKQSNRSSSEIEFEFGNSGQKPEKLIKRILEMCTSEGDVVLDFFGGSGTTAATSLKMNRKFISIEQMESQMNVEINRLVENINGKISGISKDVDWKGGGYFVYAELMEKNGGYLSDVQNAKTIDELSTVFTRMKDTTDFDFRVDLDKFEEALNEFSSLNDRKKELIRILDKNQLYYNYANIDDQDVRESISANDYQFNRSFYEGGEN